MKRREFIGLVGGAALSLPCAAMAQQSGKIARIGYLTTSLAANPHMTAAFLRGMADLGWVEGRNVIIEYRDAKGRPEPLAGFAAELVALKVDVIVATSTAAALVARQATQTIPIVFTSVPDPVTSGLIASLARPGGNATGVSNQGSDIVGKNLDLLKQVIPKANRVAVLWQPGSFGEATERDMLRQADITAGKIGVQLHFVEARNPADINGAFAEMRALDTEVLSVFTSGMLFAARGLIVEQVAKNRLPAIFPWREGADAGGLMAYGASFADSFRRAAAYVDKILKGAKPADLAVEQPVKFELVLNLKTAKTLGLTIPPLVLAQADEVIE